MTKQNVVFSVENYLAFKRNEVLLHATYTWMNLESIGPGTKDHSVSFHLHKMSKPRKVD